MQKQSPRTNLKAQNINKNKSMITKTLLFFSAFLEQLILLGHRIRLHFFCFCKHFPPFGFLTSNLFPSLKSKRETLATLPSVGFAPCQGESAVLSRVRQGKPCRLLSVQDGTQPRESRRSARAFVDVAAAFRCGNPVSSFFFLGGGSLSSRRLRCVKRPT